MAAEMYVSVESIDTAFSIRENLKMTRNTDPNKLYMYTDLMQMIVALSSGRRINGCHLMIDMLAKRKSYKRFGNT